MECFQKEAYCPRIKNSVYEIGFLYHSIHDDKKDPGIERYRWNHYVDLGNSITPSVWYQIQM